MKAITGTIYGDEIAICKEFGIPYIPRANTTLNEAISIEPNMPLNEGEYPEVSCWVAGMGGHRLTAAAGGKPKISAIKHKPSDAMLFELVPLVLRLESNDLTPAERAQYYLRKKVVIDDKNYFAYYAKLLDLSRTKVNLMRVTVVDGVTTTLPFVPSNDDLHPVPGTILPNQVMPTLDDGNYLMAIASTTIPLTEKDIMEYRNAVTILYGDEELAVISEVGLVSNIVRTVNGEGPGGQIVTIKEACVSTLTQIVSTYENLNFSDAAFDMVVNAITTKSLITSN